MQNSHFFSFFTHVHQGLTFFNYERLLVTDSFIATQAKKRSLESHVKLKCILIFLRYLY